MRNLSQHTENFALNTATLKQWSLERIIETCGARGIRAIAPWHDDVEQLGPATTRRLLREANVDLCGYCRGGLSPWRRAANARR